MLGWLKKVGRYFHNFAVAEDQAANVLLTDGKPDETISSHAQRDADKGEEGGKVISDVLDVAQKDHGHKAMKGDLKRAEDIIQTEEEGLKNVNHS
jgi:hypothetical protein